MRIALVSIAILMTLVLCGCVGADDEEGYDNPEIIEGILAYLSR